MKLFARSLGPLALLAASPLACTSPTNDLPLDDMCVQMGLDEFEFRPVGNNPIGSFEPADPTKPVLAGIDEGTMIVDDDDLADDYPIYQKAHALYDKMLADDPALAAAVEAYETSDSTSPPSTVPELIPLTDAMIEICPYYGIFNVLPAHGVAPVFTACKDRWSENGDGVVGFIDWHTGNLDDQKMVSCPSVTGGTNNFGINFWGPVTQGSGGFRDTPVKLDGFTYSGITIPLTVSTYKESADISEWEGVALWARLATAEEALDIDAPMVMFRPPLRKELPANPHAQDGTCQVGVMVQTNDTGLVDIDGSVGFTLESKCTFEETGTSGPCFADQAAFDAFDAPLSEVTDATGGISYVKYGVTDAHGHPGTVPQPFCIDYSPIDATAGEEAPYRNQCWDGFRYMKEVTTHWQFYFFPFSEMRQAGWGQVAKTFRLDQMRAVDLLTSAFQPVNVMVDEVAYYRRKK